MLERNIEPLVGESWFVGGRFFTGETISQMIERTVARDTNLILDPRRFELVAVHNYYLSNSSLEKAEQNGLPASHHAIGLTYTIALSYEEVDKLRLSDHEYENAESKKRSMEGVAADAETPQLVRDIAHDLLMRSESNSSVLFHQYIYRTIIKSQKNTRSHTLKKRRFVQQ